MMAINSVTDPSTGKVSASISEATAVDVDRAVAAARRAFTTTWGLNTPGAERGRLLNKLADLLLANGEELAALVVLENGASLSISVHELALIT